MGSKENLTKARDILRQEIVTFPLSLESDPSLWWKNFIQTYKKLRLKTKESQPELKDYMETQLGRVREVVKKNLPDIKKVSVHEIEAETIASIAESLILQVSREMAADFQPRVEGMNENLVSIGELISRKPDQIRAEAITIHDTDFIKMGLRKTKNSEWHYFLLPKTDTVGLKGGPPRAALDILASSPQSMVDAELPWNDIDVIATGNEARVRYISKIMGVDAEGVEMFSHEGEDIDFTLYCLGRDTTQNQTYLDANGLHYSDQALFSAQTGEVHVVGQYTSGRAIYGVDIINFGGVELVKPRGLMRLVKAVVEDKALSFEYKPANKIMDFGIYWLVLARKWSERPTFGEYMQRMYYLGKQMWQVRPEEKNIYDVLTRAHETYSFFDFFSPPMDVTSVAKWKAGKLIKQLDREFAWKYRIPSGIKMPNETKDLISRKISLNGFTFSSHQAERLKSYWADFLEGSKERTRVFYKDNTDVVQRFFLKSDLEESILDQYIDFED